MPGVCEECDRLWEAYAEATRAYLKIASDQQITAIQQNSALLALIEPLYQQASAKRTETRQALKDHQTTHAAKKSATQV
jgi:hypothetical protein